jgi:hypothetical protein
VQLRIDSTLTVMEAIKFIGETLNVACGGNIGLYLPDERRWLDDNAQLSQYENLQEEVRLPHPSLLLFFVSLGRFRNISNIGIATSPLTTDAVAAAAALVAVPSCDIFVCHCSTTPLLYPLLCKNPRRAKRNDE